MKRLLLYLFSLLLSGCITEYTPPYSEDEMEGLLVVEGIISNGETTITLSRSVNISSMGDPSLLQVGQARVWVEGENGERYEASPGAADGEYLVAIDRLDSNTRYRLRISLDGQEYESEYRTPQRAATIEEIDFHQKSKGEPLQVRLNLQGEVGQSRYYLWSYEEIWEVQAYQMATHYLGYPGNYDTYYSMGEANMFFGSYSSAIQEYPNNISPFYYGWKYGGSRSILLGSSDRMTENTLYDHVLYEIDIRDDRLSVLYYTKVKQYALGEEAYYYFDNLKKNTDDAGGIFAPIPSEMRGNLVCSTDPDTPVIGFVEVAEYTEKEVYLDRRNSPYVRPWHFCDSQEEIDAVIINRDPPPQYNEWEAYLLHDSDLPEGPIWTHRNCIDCRIQGGTKVRPAFWPNNHY